MLRFNKIVMAIFAIPLLISLSLLSSLSAYPYTFSYRFNATPVSEALTKLIKEHPSAKITFIYNDLDDYTTSVNVDTDDVMEAVRGITGLNPISVTEKDGQIYIEVIHRGKYHYHGRIVNEFSEPVPYATVLLLSPKDSTVVTYGITKSNGKFLIPCDRKDVIAKISSIGYRKKYMKCGSQSLGDITLNTLAINLKNIDVNADDAHLYSDRTVYVPQQRHKNSSMSAIELLQRMGIPQLLFRSINAAPTTNSGQPIAFFIDYLPASDEELSGMNLQNVKRVEYLEFPADSRFGGKPFVVNFIMTRYEYGGYFKTYLNKNFILNTTQVNEYARFQYKRMTYDLTGLGFFSNAGHNGNQTTETFRLPQPDGTMKEFNRYSNTLSSKRKIRQYRASFKATYESDNITASSRVYGTIDNGPNSDMGGTVAYSPSDFPNSTYSMSRDSRSRFIQFNGNYYFKLSDKDMLIFSPKYSFSHTEDGSNYAEKRFSPKINFATDNTNQLYGKISWQRRLGKFGTITLYGNGEHDYYRTRYSGTSDAYDRTKNTRISTVADYEVSIGNLYGGASFGWSWDNIKMNEVKSKVSSPSMSLFLQYLVTRQHQVYGNFRYSTWSPNPSFMSENVIQSNHLMSYTGNPNLVPSKTYSVNINYSWIPSNRFSLSLFGSTWTVKDRYVYDYEASADGLLRTIKQPLGSYMIGNVGVSARASFFGRALQINGNISQHFAHNGAPYNYTRFPISFVLNVNYYLKDFYFNAYYSSRNHYSDGYMVGTWMEYKDNYQISAGWANAKWNLRVTASNFARWNWISHKAWFKSRYYDNSDVVSTGDYHARFTVSATFTFGYGKKVKADRESGGGDSATSGILKN